MKTDEEIKKGLECCAKGNSCRGHCPYDGRSAGIKECTSQLARDALTLITRWISVDERLPEELKDVLVYRDGCFAIAHIITGDDWTYCGMGGDPTHWMPLPEPPEVNEK